MSSAPQPDGKPAAPARRSMVRWRHRWTLLLALYAAGLAALTFVIAANYVLVDLRLIGWRGDARLSWALLGAVVAGFIAGFASGWLKRSR